MSQPQPVLLDNAAQIAIDQLPEGPFSWLRSVILEKIAGGAFLAAFFPFQGEGGLRLLAVLMNPAEGGMTLGAAPVEDSFPSLANECPETQLFEREIAENWGLIPRGHPWLKPVRFLKPEGSKIDPRLPEWFDGRRECGVMEYFRVEGEEVHEVAVGPVHAGVIEPGHFRFQCHGEEVMHLEISLGYQHRGIEAALIGGPDKLTRPRLETAAGDTTVGHALAYALNFEALAGLTVSPEAERVRAIALELERIANHTGDLGALSGDVGFLPTASFCGRLRGDILNLTALLCGNRFGRGLVLPGGVGYGIDAEMAGIMAERLAAAARDIKGAADLLLHKPSVWARFEDTGMVSRRTANHLGLVGPAARASGLALDVRVDAPTGAYRDEPVPVPTGENGDVMDRARQRALEIEASVAFIQKLLREPCDAVRPEKTLTFAKGKGGGSPLQPFRVAVALTEGWRGQICHVAITDGEGRFAGYKVVDPSFHNWLGLAMALRGQQISDFPLCNKSFNLSYCGFDL